jgi:hypothetical protein
MDNDAERKIQKWSNQFMLKGTQPDTVRKARAHLDRAAGLAQTHEQKQRVTLFSKTFKLSEMLLEIANAEKVQQAKVDAVRKYVEETIVADRMTICSNAAVGQKTHVMDMINAALKTITAGKLVP